MRHPTIEASRGLVAFALALSAIFLGLSRASAQDLAIGPGNEATVLALFEPYTLGQEVSDGYALWNVALERTYIEVMLQAPDGRQTTITLRHVSSAPLSADRSPSFVATRSGEDDEGANRARNALFAAIQRNDHGGFWEVAAVTVEEERGDARPGDAPGDGYRGLHASLPRLPGFDGVLGIVLVYLLALLLAWRLLLDAPRWMAAALFSIVALGVLLRLALSPPVFLGAWPWSRMYPHIRAVVDGPGIVQLSSLAGHPFWVTDVMMWTNFAYAAVMPLVLFSHGTFLLRDPRIGLAAAFAVAFLPQHIRYSLCEDGFVASLVLTSLAFALLHAWLRDPSPVVRGLVICALPFVLYPGYLLRPLNILFIVVYTLAIVGLHGETAPRWRRGVALSLVLGVGAFALVGFLSTNAETAQTVTSRWEWPLSFLWVLLNPLLLVIDDPLRTPLPLMILAVLGGVLGWRAGEKRLVGFLCAWLVLFIGAHAVVVQESMQPRYHLHLVVPFLLLAASAVPRIEARFRPWLWAAAGVMVVSPLVHLGFIQDVGYTEIGEYELVREARYVVPPGCTVLEFSGGEGNAHELRFARIAERAGATSRFVTIGVGSNGETSEGAPSLDALLASPPECLYFYEGLPCSAWPGEGETYAPLCTEIRERLHGEAVLEAEVPVRLYDRANGGDGLHVSTVPLRLSRMHPHHD
jgi:hypothetical protein